VQNIRVAAGVAAGCYISTLAMCLFQVAVVVVFDSAMDAAVGRAVMAVQNELPLQQRSTSDGRCCLLHGNSFATG
jgi:hypothetical protein